MNNIYFFHHFNNLLKTHTQTNKEINHLIDDILNNHKSDITDKQNVIIDKYKELTVICSFFFDKMSNISIDIDKYLSENCQHSWTFDSIDIDPDHSRLIKYCSNCSTTNLNYCSNI